MASFDIVNEIDIQKLDNAVNVASKEIGTRFDFHGSKTSLELDKKTLILTVVTEDEMRLNTIREILIGRVMKQGLDANCLDFGKEQAASGNMIRKEVKIKKGIDKETAKKVVKVIKDSGLKVQASIMDDQVRVTGKKLDDLQAVMAEVKRSDLEIPMQFTNYRN
jgi:uncharacterized protein YajQ (UPF0234 family)